MFTLSSPDLDAVIASLEKAQSAIEKGHHAAVINHAKYKPLLEETARKVLTDLTDESEKSAIEPLVGSITAWTADIMSFEMMGTAGGVQGLEGAQPGDLGFNRLAGLMDDIEAWVREMKEKTDIDRKKFPTDEKLAWHIAGTIKNDPQAWINSKDPTGLMAYLQQRNPEAFASVFGLTRLNELRVGELLDAVLNCWVEVILPRLEAESLKQIEAALA